MKKYYGTDTYVPILINEWNQTDTRQGVAIGLAEADSAGKLRLGVAVAALTPAGQSRVQTSIIDTSTFPAAPKGRSRSGTVTG